MKRERDRAAKSTNKTMRVQHSSSTIRLALDLRTPFLAIDHNTAHKSMAGYRASGTQYTAGDITPVTHSASVRSELDQDDWRIIQKIVDAVPEGQTGIGSLDDAYVQVMDET
jgi:hypothetical protein